MNNSQRPIRIRPFDLKGYIILGFDKKENKYYGFSMTLGKCDGFAYFYSAENKLKNSVAKIMYESIHFENEFKNSHPNSINQFVYFRARQDAFKINEQNYCGLKWKVYRVNSKYCPVNADMSIIKDYKMHRYKGKIGYKYLYVKFTPKD